MVLAARVIGTAHPAAASLSKHFQQQVVKRKCPRAAETRRPKRKGNGKAGGASMWTAQQPIRYRGSMSDHRIHNALLRAPIRPGWCPDPRLQVASRMTAEVQDVSLFSDAFAHITFKGEGLKKIHWQPGDAVRIAMGGRTARTMTPLWWDLRKGETAILLYRHRQVVRDGLLQELPE